MAEEEKKKGEISRREFLKDAGLVVGGAAIGSAVLLAACAPKEGGATVTVTSPPVTKTVTTTVTPTGAAEELTKLTINGKIYEYKIEPNWSLQYVLHDKLGLIGTHLGCDQGECGACTVVMDGKAIYSCITLAADMEGHDIETIEGLLDPKTGALHPLQEAFAIHSCGCFYCATGMMMSAKAFLSKNPNPTRQEVKEAISGNLCKCGNYKEHVDSILVAAQKMRGG